MSAAVKVRPARYCGGDWIADTSTGCGCEIGGFTGCGPTRIYADLGHALDFARAHAETHTCPSWRASGERCTEHCADCGGAPGGFTRTGTTRTPRSCSPNSG